MQNQIIKVTISSQRNIFRELCLRNNQGSKSDSCFVDEYSHETKHFTTNLRKETDYLFSKSIKIYFNDTITTLILDDCKLKSIDIIPERYYIIL